MGDQDTRQSRSPQRDKLNSYKHDCRDRYGENNKSKRTAIPAFKARSNRQARHLAKIVIAHMTGSEAVDEERDLQEADQKASRPWKTKSPDMPLGKMLARRRAQRD